MQRKNTASGLPRPCGSLAARPLATGQEAARVGDPLGWPRVSFVFLLFRFASFFLFVCFVCLSGFGLLLVFWLACVCACVCVCVCVSVWVCVCVCFSSLFRFHYLCVYVGLFSFLFFGYLDVALFCFRFLFLVVVCSLLYVFCANLTTPATSLGGGAFFSN